MGAVARCSRAFCSADVRLLDDVIAFEGTNPNPADQPLAGKRHRHLCATACATACERFCVRPDVHHSNHPEAAAWDGEHATLDSPGCVGGHV